MCGAGYVVIGVLVAGPLVGHKIVGVRMVLEDGASHCVDSSENAFKQAAIGAIRTCECRVNADLAHVTYIAT